MFCKHGLTFSHKGQVGLVQNRTGVISEQEQSLQNQYYSYWTHLGMAIYNSIYIERLYIPACVNLRWWQGFRNYFLELCQSFHDKRRVFKLILTAEIEIIPWYLIFFQIIHSCTFILSSSN